MAYQVNMNALAEAIASPSVRGAGKAVPAIPEPKNTSAEERTVNLAISNSGKPLKPLEMAKIVRRLIDWGWSEPDIATKLGWKSRATVQQHLEMMAMPEAVKEQIRQGDVSATLAKKIVKETRDAKSDPEFAANLIAANKAENARIRGKDKRHKVTAKTIKRDRAKLQSPRATPEQIAEVLGDRIAQHVGAMGRAILTPEHTEPTGFIGDELHTELPAPSLPSALAGTQNQIPQTDATLEVLIELTKQAHICVQHNQSDDHPGWWSSDLVEAIRKARNVVERLTGEPMEFETLPDPSSQDEAA